MWINTSKEEEDLPAAPTAGKEPGEAGAVPSPHLAKLPALSTMSSRE